jgi:hypothetical protein
LVGIQFVRPFGRRRNSLRGNGTGEDGSEYGEQ